MYTNFQGNSMSYIRSVLNKGPIGSNSAPNISSFANSSSTAYDIYGFKPLDVNFSSGTGIQGVRANAVPNTSIGTDYTTKSNNSGSYEVFDNNPFMQKDTPWYKDSGFLGGGANLLSAISAFAALPGQLDLAKTQTKGLKQNIAFAKQEQDRRNKNISGFNAFDVGGPTTSAFSNVA